MPNDFMRAAGRWIYAQYPGGAFRVIIASGLLACSVALPSRWAMPSEMVISIRAPRSHTKKGSRRLHREAMGRVRSPDRSKTIPEKGPGVASGTRAHEVGYEISLRTNRRSDPRWGNRGCRRGGRGD